MNTDEAFEKWRKDLRNPVSHCNSCGSVDIDDLLAFKAGAESQAETIKSLREDLKWALKNILDYSKYNDDANEAKALIKKHGLDV